MTLHTQITACLLYTSVTADFANYCLPLIQGETKLEKEDGLPRFARLKKVFAK